jgi:hypothetical protein
MAAIAAASVMGPSRYSGRRSSAMAPARLARSHSAVNVGFKGPTYQHESLDQLNLGRKNLEKLRPRGRSGADLWSHLRSMLQEPNNVSSTLLANIHGKRRTGLHLQWGQNQGGEATPQVLMNVRGDRERIAQEHLDRQTCLFDPEAPFFNYWVSLQCALLVYIAALVPFRIGFELEAEPWEFLFVFDILVDIYFVVDMVLVFNTAFLDGEGRLRVERSEIRANYMAFWFWIDFVSVIPLHYIAYLPGADDGTTGGGNSNKIVRLIRLAKLLRLLRVARIARIVDKYEEVSTAQPTAACPASHPLF